MGCCGCMSILTSGEAESKPKTLLDVPKGKNMFVTKNHAESEIVLPRNTKFKVTKLKSSGGITEVKLKVM